ncbi:hypothetical protein XELAEV_18041650mg [Xenopus laevis]|uniref:Dolichyldiphosphatase n=1 Tax=Xenopus laevis TaxID=8355 RepID=A0A974C2J2_XENLA|nr:hypothetical protein XELAEV_18041650mg [Xenopus laevis]
MFSNKSFYPSFYFQNVRRRYLRAAVGLPQLRSSFHPCQFSNADYIQEGASHGVNWLIKNIVREPRPCEGNHSQFMWFFSVYSFLFLYLRMHQTNNARFLDLLWRHVLSLCLLMAAFLVSYSRCAQKFLAYWISAIHGFLMGSPFFSLRVYLVYHSWSQVVYGGVAGGVLAIVWFVITQEILTPLFPRIAAWPISEFFLIRDTSLIPNILWFEYTVTRAEASARNFQPSPNSIFQSVGVPEDGGSCSSNWHFAD